MDTSDTTLTFDERGWCDYCCNYHKNIASNWHPGERGIAEIMPVIEKIKREGKGRDHDCLIGCPVRTNHGQILFQLYTVYFIF